MAIPVAQALQRIHYPSSDGQPVAESDFQLRPLLYTVTALRTYFQDRADVYVAGNIFIYYEEGNSEAVVAPDVFVVLGTAKRDRSSYMLWEEPKGPDFVLEITSRSTRTKDQGPKRGTYAFLGVREYFQYDPTHDYLVPPLQGAYLIAGSYQPLSPTTLPDGTLVLHSDVLGLDLRLEGDTLRFYDPVTGQRLLSHEEIAQAWREAEERAVREETARQAAEARIAALEARLRERGNT